VVGSAEGVEDSTGGVVASTDEETGAEVGSVVGSTADEAGDELDSTGGGVVVAEAEASILTSRVVQSD
jgi:hypothetical protein